MYSFASAGAGLGIVAGGIGAATPGAAFQRAMIPPPTKSMSARQMAAPRVLFVLLSLPGALVRFFCLGFELCLEFLSIGFFLHETLKCRSQHTGLQSWQSVWRLPAEPRDSGSAHGTHVYKKIWKAILE
jgi:hypothetical protein